MLMCAKHENHLGLCSFRCSAKELRSNPSKFIKLNLSRRPVPILTLFPNFILKFFFGKGYQFQNWKAFSLIFSNFSNFYHVFFVCVCVSLPSICFRVPIFPRNQLRLDFESFYWIMTLFPNSILFTFWKGNQFQNWKAFIFFLNHLPFFGQNPPKITQFDSLSSLCIQTW